MITRSIIVKQSIAHTKVPNPHLLAMKLIIGKRQNITGKVDIPIINKRFSPNARLILAKQKNWNIPVVAPYPPMMYPIVEGGRARPPISSGMDKKRGRRAMKAMLRKARVK